jgi:hypothetical protein
MTAALAVDMDEKDNPTSTTENQAVQKEVDRILLRLRQSKAFQRAVGHTMSSNGYGSIRLDIARGKVTRIVSEAVYLEKD